MATRQTLCKCGNAARYLHRVATLLTMLTTLFERCFNELVSILKTLFALRHEQPLLLDEQSYGHTHTHTHLLNCFALFFAGNWQLGMGFCWRFATLTASQPVCIPQWPKQAKDIFSTNTQREGSGGRGPQAAPTPVFNGGSSEMSGEKFQTRFNKIQFVAHFNAFR